MSMADVICCPCIPFSRVQTCPAFAPDLLGTLPAAVLVLIEYLLQEGLKMRGMVGKCSPAWWRLGKVASSSCHVCVLTSNTGTVLVIIRRLFFVKDADPGSIRGFSKEKNSSSVLFKCAEGSVENVAGGDRSTTCFRVGFSSAFVCL